MVRLLPRFLIALLAVAAGCGPTTPPKPVAGPAAGPPPLKEYPADAFQWGEPLPLLERGTLEMSDPVGWTRLPRRSGYIARFYWADRQTYPKIQVTVEEAGQASPGDLDADSARDYAERLKAAFLDRNDRSLIELPEPIKLGEHYCVRYVKSGKVESFPTPLERQIIELPHGSKIYRVELLVFRDMLPVHRDAGYAVVAGMKFREGSVEPEVTPQPAGDQAVAGETGNEDSIADPPASPPDPSE